MACAHRRSSLTRTLWCETTCISFCFKPHTNLNNSFKKLANTLIQFFNSSTCDSQWSYKGVEVRARTFDEWRERQYPFTPIAQSRAFPASRNKPLFLCTERPEETDCLSRDSRQPNWIASSQLEARNLNTPGGATRVTVHACIHVENSNIWRHLVRYRVIRWFRKIDIHVYMNIANRRYLNQNVFN